MLCCPPLLSRFKEEIRLEMSVPSGVIGNDSIFKGESYEKCFFKYFCGNVRKLARCAEEGQTN